METKELLTNLGLREAEAKIYLALLRHGQVSIRTLAAQTTINRGQVYESLKKLSAIGLVSFIRKGQRRSFAAESPEKILDLLNERKKELQQVQTAAQNLIPALMAAGKRNNGEPLVRFYEDNEGIETILRDVLVTTSRLANKEYYLYSSLPLRRFIHKSFPNFTKRRIKEGIFVKVIAVGKGGDTAELSERKFLPGPSGETTSSYTIVYADKVALVSVSADQTPYGVVIEEPGVASMQKYLFEQLWQKL
jgi:sugar-specific transcriptional regulator TrmB